MERSVVFAGFGGQGLLFAGQLLAHAAVLDGLEVLWIPSYGPEMRGGTASCTVIVGDEPIGSPVVDRADVAVAMNPPSLAKWGGLVARGGLLVENSSLIAPGAARGGVEELRIPCSELARRAGDDRLVSLIALGALVGRRPLVRPASIRAAIREIVSARRPEALRADVAAFALGLRVARRPAGGAAAPAA